MTYEVERIKDNAFKMTILHNGFEEIVIDELDHYQECVDGFRDYWDGDTFHLGDIQCPMSESEFTDFQNELSELKGELSDVRIK